MTIGEIFKFAFGAGLTAFFVGGSLLLLFSLGKLYGILP